MLQPIRNICAPGWNALHLSLQNASNRCLRKRRRTVIIIGFMISFLLIIPLFSDIIINYLFINYKMGRTVYSAEYNKPEKVHFFDEIFKAHKHEVFITFSTLPL